MSNFQKVAKPTKEFVRGLAISAYALWQIFQSVVNNHVDVFKIVSTQVWLMDVVNQQKPIEVIVCMENIGFVYPAMSMMVIGPSLPIPRQSRWSLLYDVYWLETMGTTGNRQRDRNTWTRSRIIFALSLLNNKKARNRWNENKTNNRTKNKINKQLITNKSTNNESRITTNWHKHLHNWIYDEYLFFIEASLNVTVLVLHWVKISLWLQN